MQSQIQPNQTLYVRNLKDKLAKSEMKRILYLLFSQYGRIIEIILLKTEKMRGQAHIVFQDVMHSTQAMRSLNGFQLLGKPLMIQFAKTKSNVIRRLEGDFEPSVNQQPAERKHIEVDNEEEEEYDMEMSE